MPVAIGEDFEPETGECCSPGLQPLRFMNEWECANPDRLRCYLDLSEASMNDCRCIVEVLRAAEDENEASSRAWTKRSNQSHVSRKAAEDQLKHLVADLASSSTNRPQVDAEMLRRFQAIMNGELVFEKADEAWFLARQQLAYDKMEQHYQEMISAYDRHSELLTQFRNDYRDYLTTA